MGSSGERNIHVLLLPFLVQGHINPLLQFGKRLASHSGVRCTLAATRFVVSSTKPSSPTAATAAGPTSWAGWAPPTSSGSSRRALRRWTRSSGRSRSWGGPWTWWCTTRSRRGRSAWRGERGVPDADVRRGHPVRHAWAGRVPPPPLRPEDVRGLDGLPCQLEVSDMPTFLSDTSYPPCFRELLVNQFLGMDTAEHVLVNSFYDLEPQEADYMASRWRAKMIGPTVPSAFLDKRLPDDVSYGIHLHTPMTAESKAWLDAQQPRSVLYVSFGSMASLGPDQMREIAEGLYGSGKPFLWVVRATEADKLPEGFAGGKAKGSRGLIVPWCPQLEVLAHPAVGCFMTHCGWNSTVEALAAGVPMVAMPNWSDQTTNAKYIQDVWRVGVRVRPDDDGGVVVRSAEVERCVREVMEGEMCEEFRTKALEWSAKARKSMSEGGASDVNTSDFLSTFGHTSIVLTPKIGTRTKLTCGPDLVNRYHSAKELSPERSVKTFCGRERTVIRQGNCSTEGIRECAMTWTKYKKKAG